VECLIGQGKVAMIISGPWTWSNLIASGIDFGLAPMPGVDRKPARPFVEVSAAYIAQYIFMKPINIKWVLQIYGLLSIEV
jgi:maltose/maltodextrin transport system substrate-binding protein